MKGHWYSIQCSHECVYIHIDYMITMLLSLSLSLPSSFLIVLYACRCVVVVGLHICVRVGRVDQYEKKKKLRREKTSTRPLPLRFSARSSYWAPAWCIGSMCVCVCATLSLYIEDRKALDEVKKRKERKPRQTCKARLQKVSPSCTCVPPAFDLSLSVFFH